MGFFALLFIRLRHAQTKHFILDKRCESFFFSSAVCQQTSLYAQAGDLPSVLEFKSSAPSGRHHFSTKRPVPNLMQYLTKMNGIAIKRTDNLSCLHVSYAVVCLPKWAGCH